MIRRARGIQVLLLLGLAAQSLASAPGAAQEPTQVIRLARGASELLVLPERIERVSVGDPEVASPVVVSPREVLVNARAIGTTSLFVWDASGGRRHYTVEVGADAAAIQRQLRALFPGEPIEVAASGDVVILSGRVRDRGLAARALEIARASGATVVDNLQQPAPQQVLLQVRFAEVTRTAADRFGADLRVAQSGRILAPDHVLSPGDWVAETLSDGLMRLFLFGSDVQLEAVINALRATGTFRSLAEPNLLAVEGQEASFLAGGEFPVPVPQPGASNVVTVMFKEFGIRLRFIPRITPEGSIRLTVAPEVSTLDFANGVRLSGFQIPSLLTRRAATEVELRAGQTFAIAGLMDSSIQRNVRRLPLLGEIPVLGALFGSREVQQNRTELMVLVTPILVQPTDAPPALPPGEPAGWDWLPHLRERPVPAGSR